MVQYLIDRGEDIEKVDWDGRTPLLLAKDQNVPIQEIVDILRAAGAKDVNIPSSILQLTKLQDLVRDGDLGQIKEMLENEKGLNIDQRNNFGSTALFYACYRGQAEVVKLLIDKGASLTLKDDYERIPLDVALMPEIRLLLKSEMKARRLESYIPQDGSVHQPSCPHSFPHTLYLCDGCGHESIEWEFFYREYSTLLSQTHR